MLFKQTENGGKIKNKFNGSCFSGKQRTLIANSKADIKFYRCKHSNHIKLVNLNNEFAHFPIKSARNIQILCKRNSEK